MVQDKIEMLFQLLIDHTTNLPLLVVNVNKNF